MLLDIFYLTGMVYGIQQASKEGLTILLLRMFKNLMVITLSLKMVYFATADIKGLLLIHKIGIFAITFFIIGWFFNTITENATEELGIEEEGPVSQTLAVIVWLFACSTFCSFLCNIINADENFWATSFTYQWIVELWPIAQSKFEYLKKL